MSKAVAPKQLLKRLEEKDEGPRINFTVRLPESLIQRFKKTCDGKGRTNTEVIEEFVRMFVEELEKPSRK